jgi:DnaJ-class molecular chaperone
VAIPDREEVTAMQRDYYLVLGVSRDETARGIHDAYRQLVKKHHLDHAGPQDTQAFREVVEAYEVLSDAEKRRRHTQGLRRAEGRLDVAPDTIVFSEEAPAEPLAPDPVSLRHGFQHVHPSAEALLDRLMHNMLRERAPKGERVEALNMELVLSPAEAARGGDVRLGVPVFRSCPWCGGAGGDWLHLCPACDGQGAMAVEQPVGVSIPPMVRDRTVLEMPLHGVGITNFHLRLHIRIDPWA